MDVWICTMCVNSCVTTFRSQLCVPRNSKSMLGAYSSILLSKKYAAPLEMSS